MDFRDTFNEIKRSKIKEGCCFKKRIADFFLIGVTRAISKKILPKQLDKKQEYDAFNISPVDTGNKTRTLSDKKDFWNLFKVIAFTHNIIDAGMDKENKSWKESHHIIIDGQVCTRIVEEYFKGGWSSPFNDNFYKLISSDFPDDKIIEELGIMDLKLEHID